MRYSRSKMLRINKGNGALAIVFLVLVFLLSGCGEVDETEELMADYRAAVASSDYIIHALGGENEKFYINSLDMLDKCYQAGYRVFEADVSFTSDDVLVCAHSGENNVWTRNDWELRLGQEYPFEKEQVLASNGYDIEKRTCTYDTFMTFKIQGEYTATSFGELLDYMEDHTDMYLMLDAGHRTYEDTKKYYEKVVTEAGGRTDVLDRIIAGGQTTEMVKAAREAYDFPLINLYFDNDEKREEMIYDPEDFVKYCDEEGITSLSCDKDTFTGEAAKVLADSDLIIYVFTINDSAEAEDKMSLGADMVGTDFLWDK
ncbi:Glycerophosphoryl diester phosphodiesterase family protein [Lachnospiraceae bacterium NE2001]|nr:Glycerophosphoryl diester phosphodiesterase family protein [Lachnospiraceae bacterium NE2001]